MQGVGFYTEEIQWQLDLAEETAHWIASIFMHFNKKAEEVNYIFTNDEFLLQMNQQYLQHDWYTDVLTFDYSLPDATSVVGDVFISIDRIRENATEYRIQFIDELHRIMAHGALHLLGYTDTTEKEKEEMHKLENFCLSLRMF